MLDEVIIGAPAFMSFAKAKQLPEDFVDESPKGFRGPYNKSLKLLVL